MATASAFSGRYLKQLSDRHQVTVLAFDYRGYGKSEGVPSEAGILADGHAAQQWLAERFGMQAGGCRVDGAFAGRLRSRRLGG